MLCYHRHQVCYSALHCVHRLLDHLLEQHLLTVLLGLQARRMAVGELRTEQTALRRAHSSQGNTAEAKELK